MGLVKIRFEVANEAQFSRAFRDAANLIKDLTIPLTEMAEDFYGTMPFVFATEGAHETGKTWQELSPAYARWKMQHYPGRKILELTGRLKRSLTERGNSDAILNITPSQLVVGTRVPYALYHQQGAPKRNLPIRKIIDLTDNQKVRWTHIMHNHLHKIYEKAGKDTRTGASI